jgi:hypothetical protein
MHCADVSESWHGKPHRLPVEQGKVRTHTTPLGRGSLIGGGEPLRPTQRRCSRLSRPRTPRRDQSGGRPNAPLEICARVPRRNSTLDPMTQPPTDYPPVRSHPSLASRYGDVFAQTITSGLVGVPLAHVTVLSFTSVTGLLRGRQDAMTSTSSWLHSALHADASQLARVTRTAELVLGDAVGPGGPEGPAAP